MDKCLRKKLYVWAYEKIKSKPKQFGADGCNALFMKTYLFEVHGVELPLSAMKTISTVSRIKSELLLKNPQFDNREKDKSKKRKITKTNQEQKPTKTALS